MHKKMYYLLRTLQISSLVIICSVIAYQFISLRNTSDGIRYQQTERFAYSLTNLAASEASRYLSQQKDKDLQLLIKELRHDPIVRDVTIYDQFGKVIFQSKDAIPLPLLLKIESSDKQRSQGIIPHIAELYKDNEKIGYIRISLEQEKILSLINDYQEKSFSTMLLLFVLSFLVGTIIMALFFKRIEASYYRLSGLIPRLIAQNQQNLK
ncbi:MAG: membrane protein [Psychromonas sp.]|jgi:membrane protein|uniref:AhpA/YtjB family protein n=1 Tax=Psychromonas sp. TaxID=1884585 RepID=UPI0039E5FE1E